MLKKFRAYFICIALVFIFILLFLNGFFMNLDYKLMDLKFNIRGSRPISSDIAVITVDEKSIKELGRFPWARSKHADLIKKLNFVGVKIIVFDILFTEKDLENPRGDIEFAMAIKKSTAPIVLAEFFLFKDGVITEVLKPIDMFRSYAKLGHVNIFPETDGIVRKTPVLIYYNGEFHPSLSWIVYSILKNKDVVEAAKEKGFLHSQINEVMINFIGGLQSVKYYSYSDVINGKFLDELKDKIVFIGGTATGLFDFKAVPNTPVFPGVEIHVHALENFLSENYFKELFVEVIFMVLLISLVSTYFTLKIKNVLMGVFYPIISTFIFAAMDLYLFSKNFQIFSFVIYLSNFVIYFSITIYRYIMAELEKAWIKKAFSQYLSPQVMYEVMKNPSKVSIGGKRQVVTILFTDIERFTEISETLDPERLTEVINIYFDVMTKVIFKYNGLVNKFIGDAILAFWNAPIEQTNHEYLACSAAVEMLKAEDEVNKKINMVLKTRIGIHTGEAIVGNFGSEKRYDYTVMGDSVNLASRLEGVNKRYGTRVIISETTYDAIKDGFNIRKLDLVRVKGKEKPVFIYSIELKNIDCKLFNEAVDLYFKRDFIEAKRLFSDFKQKYPEDEASSIYIERCNYYILNPPSENWDGVYVFETK
ncbi:MAG: adenylate/guanylate cyclase domain-containing protein [bacterium]|nr:adenylate/guanylate cyclase domain-containing protein [bacterium]